MHSIGIDLAWGERAQTGIAAAGSTNCGRSAMKNSATFGFSTSTMKESSRARFTVFGGATGWSAAFRRERIMPMPIQIR